MKQYHKTLIFGLLAITLLDTLGSVASRQLGFNYAFLSPISFLIYGATAFIATKQKDLSTGVTFASILGLFESTVGWQLSILFHANTGEFDNQPTIGMMIISAVFMTGFAALVGLAGGRLAKGKNPIS
ncbi:MAG: hypothetical protein AAGI38_10375 [Bacteroidota bacterium]